MILDCRELAAGTVLSLPFRLETALAAEDLAEDVLDASADVSGRAENHAGYLTLTGSIVLNGTFRCARCCTEFQRELSFPMDYKLAMNLSDNDSNESEEEFLLLEDGCLDLDEVVRTQLLTEMPYRFLCKEDCKGLCPVCGRNRNEQECTCSQNERDPRWDALARFFEE